VLEDFCDVVVKPVADGGEGSVEAIKELKECEFLIACDVDNPLYGQKGVAYVYAPQKGANGRMVKQLDDGLKNFAGLVKERWRANLLCSPNLYQTSQSFLSLQEVLV